MRNEQKLTFKLSNVDLVKKTGTLRVKKEGNQSGYKLSVTLSNQLVGKIKFHMKSPKHKMAIDLVDVPFTSFNGSPDYKENPFKLVEFKREGQPSTFKLQMVDDKGYSFTHYVNAMQQRADKVKFKHWKKSQYLRYWAVTLPA